MSEQVVAAFDGTRSGSIDQITLHFVGTKAYSEFKWWMVEDRGGWPLHWRQPYLGLQSTKQRAPWPSEWRWRPHP